MPLPSFINKMIEARKIEQAIPVGNFFIQESLFLRLGTAESAFLAAQTPLTHYFQSEFQSELKKICHRTRVSRHVEERKRVDWVYGNYDINIFLAEQTSQKVSKTL